MMLFRVGGNFCRWTVTVNTIQIPTLIEDAPVVTPEKTMGIIGTVVPGLWIINRAWRGER